MNLYIDETELHLLLVQKRDFIKNKIEGLDTLFAGLSFTIPILCAKYENFFAIPGEVIQTICVMLGLFFVGRGLYLIHNSKKNSYSHETLFKEICDLNTHPFSIVAVKDTFNKHPNRFLLYYEERWKCKFFFSYKTNIDNNEDSIKSRLSNELKIDSSTISLDFKTEKTYDKYSVSDQCMKTYVHKIYLAKISEFPELLKQKEFEIDGIHYYWMTIREMENDSRIKDINMDVVDLIKKTIP